MGKEGFHSLRFLKLESWFTACWRQSAYFTMNIWTYLRQTLPYKPGLFQRKQAVHKGQKNEIKGCITAINMEAGVMLTLGLIPAEVLKTGFHHHSGGMKEKGGVPHAVRLPCCLVRFVDALHVYLLPSLLRKVQIFKKSVRIFCSSFSS